MELILEGCPEGIVLLDGSGAVVSFNSAACHILGRETKELLGHRLVETSHFVHPDGRPWPREEHPAVLALRTRAHRDAVPMGLEHPRGGRRWLSVSARPLPREGSEGPELLAVYLTDITALEEARAEQQRRADALSRMVENSPDLMVEVDDACQYVYVNQAFEAISQPRQMLLGQRLGRRGLPPEVGARWEEAARAALATGQTQRLEFELQETRGDRTWDCQVFPGRNDGASPKTIFFTAREITEYKRVERRLAETASSLDAAQRIARMGNWDWDIPSGGLRWSAQIYRLFGLDTSSFAATYDAFLAAVHPEDRGRVQQAVDAALRNERPYAIDHRIVQPDGTELVVHEEAEVIRDAKGRPVRMIGTVHDVTTQKQTEARLRFTQFTVDYAGDSVFWVDRNGRLFYVNRIVAEKLGYREEELLRMSVPDIDPRFTIESWRQHWNQLKQVGCLQFETTHRTHAGKILPMEVTAQYVEFEGRECVVGIVRDISERKRAEEERIRLLAEAEAARHEAEAANRAKDLFLAMVSHELRVPLSTMLLRTQKLQRNNPSPEELAQGLARIEASARTQEQLIEDLLDVSAILSGKLSLEKKEMDLCMVLQAAVDSVQEAAEHKGVRLEVAPCAHGVRLHGDPVRLQQVFWNLLNNAIKFTPPDGQVTVRLDIRSNGRPAVGRITVMDTGKGFSSEFLPRLFDPFSQAELPPTRSNGGLGLGLAIAKTLVDAHGGTILARSDGPDLGAVFIVELPLADAVQPIPHQPTLD